MNDCPISIIVMQSSVRGAGQQTLMNHDAEHVPTLDGTRCLQGSERDATGGKRR
ncbi:MAG: hypothetical protein ACC658_00280 [Acidimicrobiia bacterium]